MKEIAASHYSLNVSRYVSTAQQKAEADLAATHGELVEIENAIREATAKQHQFLKELGLPYVTEDSSADGHVTNSDIQALLNKLARGSPVVPSFAI